MSVSSVAPKLFWGNDLTLSEQQYFVLDAASQSTKLQDMLEIWWICPPRPPWLRLWHQWTMVVRFNISLPAQKIGESEMPLVFFKRH